MQDSLENDGRAAQERLLLKIADILLREGLITRRERILFEQHVREG